jgi:sucrose-6-phosphate hydrolase SacC (GH32 family)
MKNEIYRPQFHYTAPQNWLNDATGLLYFEAEYHLFHDYNPRGLEWGNIHWYHAVSEDLVHWEHLGIALSMEEHGRGGHIFSGSGVVDLHNTSGFGTSNEPALVLVYTVHEIGSDAETQNIAFSTDKGRTWLAFDGNPVIEAEYTANQRDPKVFWYQQDAKWVMVLYENGGIAFYSSQDLRNWSYMSRFNGESGFYECPDLFELPVDGNEGDTRWVIHDAGLNGYMLGEFDGMGFRPDNYMHPRLDYGGNFYAAQSFDNLPDRRRVQIAWMANGQYPGMPFNQQMSFPCELSLKTTPEGIRLFRSPVEEIRDIREVQMSLHDLIIKPDDDVLQGVNGDTFEIMIEMESRGGEVWLIDLGDLSVRYYFKDEMIVLESPFGCGWERLSKPMKPVVNRVKIQLLVDRTSIEIFGNDGRISMSSCYLHHNRDENMHTTIRFEPSGGEILIHNLEFSTIRSIWG